MTKQIKNKKSAGDYIFQPVFLFCAYGLQVFIILP